MQCPNCKSDPLKPAKLEPNLSCSICSECDGTLLSRVSYRLWCDNHPVEIDEVEVSEDPQNTEDTTRPPFCPKCARIIFKFKFSSDLNHGLDVCIHCEDVWLDRGEWDYLKVRKIEDQLPRIFTNPWQRRLRKERTEQALESEWLRRLGDTDFTEAERVHEWLKDHPKRDVLVAFLTSKNPYCL